MLLWKAKQFQANLDAANKTIDDLRAELADHKDKANSQLTATLAMAEARASELSTELYVLPHVMSAALDLNIESFCVALLTTLHLLLWPSQHCRANVHHRLEERCQLILCNLYSFVMAAGSKHAGYLFKRGSAYDGQMHSAKSKNVGGLQGGLFSPVIVDRRDSINFVSSALPIRLPSFDIVRQPQCGTGRPKARNIR